jgi:uncharacterized pyridoxal phosphate-containing UPF0001 family protein
VESCDREELIDSLSATAATDSPGAPLSVMLEVNSGEEQKRGFRGMDNLLHAAEKVLMCKSLALCGLMTLAPLAENIGRGGGNNESEIRKAFSNLRDAKQSIEEKFACKIPELSMGMSGDFKIAIEEGSTLVRIGQAIFGERV